MSLEGLNSDIKKLINTLEEELPRQVLIAGNDAAALIKKRVVSTGETDKAPKTYKSGYYSSLRKSKGRQTGFKDYFFTGKLWNSVKAIPSTIKTLGGNVFSIEVTSTDSEREKIIGYQNERQNIDLLHLKPEEEESIKSKMIQRIDRIIKKCLT